VSSCDVDRRSELARTEGRNHCITCGDIAVEMRVLALDDAGLARCACEDGEEQVDVALVEPVHEGDAVLVHAGVALVRVP
jgi:hydrogenase expression/formation protein HypC